MDEGNDNSPQDVSCGGVENAEWKQGENVKLQEKIDVIQQMLTVLETTMSSAQRQFQKKQEDDRSRINDLQLEINKIRDEMTQDESNFRNVTRVLETSIQKYIASENKLRTIEETSQDDYIILPDTDPETNNFIVQYSEGKQSEWRTLVDQCQTLNRDTRTIFRNDVVVRRFKIVIPFLPIHYKTVGKANALNMLRGKKFISGNQAPDKEHFVTMTCYKNEESAVRYIDENSKILKDVLCKQYDECRSENSLVITELLRGDEFNPESMMESTIHVQAKSNSAICAPSMPRRITLYQFDENERACSQSPQVLTFDIVDATDTTTGLNNNTLQSVDSTSSSQPQLPTTSAVSMPEGKNPGKVFENRISIDSASIINPNRDSMKIKLKLNKRPTHQQYAMKTAAILSQAGFTDDETESDRIIKEKTDSCIADLIQTGSSKTAGTSSSQLNAPFQPESEETALDIDGIKLSKWALSFASSKGIESFTKTQKEFLKSFESTSNGDVLYKGVSNSGKTTAMIIGLLNNLVVDIFRLQGIIVTPSNRCSKLIQKLTAIEANQCAVFCRRFDELVGNKGDRLFKASKQPPCQLVVGSAQEMLELAIKGLVNIDRVKYLVLYKMDEIFGPESIRKSTYTNIIKILYALSAKIKVIVICKPDAKMCKELQDICKTKLRNKIVLEEAVDMEEFSKGRRRTKSGDKKAGKRLISTESPISSCDLVQSNVPLESENRVLETDANKRSSEVEVPDCEYRTFISLEYCRFLGISLGPGKYTNSEAQIEVEHIYANVDDGSDSSKADVLSLLDLEEDKAVIFCNSTEKTEWLSTRLRRERLLPQVLHDGVHRDQQRAILNSFRLGSFCRILICTDFILTISLDASDVVVNFDLPKSTVTYQSRAAFAFRQINDMNSDASSQLEKKGVVVNLIVNDDMPFLKKLEEDLQIQIKDCED